MLQLKKIIFLLIIITSCIKVNSQNSGLYIGTATADISPKLPVALLGQFELRIAHTATTPLTANVIAMESRKGNQSVDMAIMVSCDLAKIPNTLLDLVRNRVHQQMPELDVNKIFLNAIHTHTAPVLQNNWEASFGYQIPKVGVTQVDDYREFFVKQVADAIVKAWKHRCSGNIAWGLSHAVIANNRRISYSDGTTQMYGETNQPKFMNLEGTEDHDVNVLFFWDKSGKLIATAIDIPCPAQEVENDSTVNADYWHPVRLALRKRFGANLCVLGWIGAAGDQSPHLMYRKSAEERMCKLRNLSHLDEISRRVVNAVEEAYETVKNNRHSDALLIHKVETLTLPGRVVTKAECDEAMAIRDNAASQIAADPKAADRVFSQMLWFNNVVTRYEDQRTNPQPKYEMELHVLRIGDVAVCTSEFELFTDYGIRIQARSKALQTFTLELVGGGNAYLPTDKAIKAGGYSAIVASNLVGSEGGQMLVDHTVDLINSLWP